MQNRNPGSIGLFVFMVIFIVLFSGSVQGAHPEPRPEKAFAVIGPALVKGDFHNYPLTALSPGAINLTATGLTSINTATIPAVISISTTKPKATRLTPMAPRACLDIYSRAKLPISKQLK